MLCAVMMMFGALGVQAEEMTDGLLLEVPKDVEPVEPVPQQQALVVSWQRMGEALQSQNLALTAETNGRWLWVQAPMDAALAPMALSYSPGDEGTVLVYPPMEAVQTLEAQQPQDAGALDFSQSDTRPYPFTVVSILDGVTPLWTGWLTVSYQPRPVDLPDVPPVPTVPPVTNPPITEPPVTEPPVTEPPVTVPPVTQPPITQQPITRPPVTAPPVTPPPITRPPVTWPPVTIPPVVPTPARSGYGLITATNVNLRETPSGTILGRLQGGDVIYINDIRYDWMGTAWYVVNVMGSGTPGYVMAAYARYMTPQEEYDYLHRPTPAPTAGVTVGYARVTWTSTTMRTIPSTGAASVKGLYAGDVVYITGTTVDMTGTRWCSVRSDGDYGYVLAGALRMMTAQEVADYLDSRPTTRPTVQPTLNPNETYARVKLENVNFRQSPDGAVIRRVSSGTVARVLQEGIRKGGYEWYYVEIGNELGYLRADMVDIIQVRPTMTPRPTATPRPTPGPTPVPLPTAGPMSLMDRVRAAVDTPVYRSYAQASKRAVSYAIADLDSDRKMELLLIVPETVVGIQVVHLEAYKRVEGEVVRIAEWTQSPALQTGTTLRIDLLEMAGRTYVYIERRDTLLNRPASTQFLTLTELGWIERTPSGMAGASTPILTAMADQTGKVTYDDRTELRETAPDDTAGLSGLLRVLLELTRQMAQGNG